MYIRLIPQGLAVPVLTALAYANKVEKKGKIQSSLQHSLQGIYSNIHLSFLSRESILIYLLEKSEVNP